MIVGLILLLIQLPSSPAERLRESTAAIAQGSSTAERRAAIVERLKLISVDFRMEDFTSGNRTGTNIVATIPSESKTRSLLLGAHYDRVARGQGAVDNAASCAVLLDLAASLKAKPPANTTVTIVFFDLEEAGLLGSRAYFQAASVSDRPTFAMNFDIFGYGESLFVTPSMPDGPLIAALQKAATEFGFPVRSFPMAKYPDSDHRSMAAAGIETLGVTLIDGAEIDSIITPGPVRPRILSMIHTNADRMDQVREQDIAKAVPVIERTIRIIDAIPH